MNIRKVKKSVIFVGYRCNNNCIFCIFGDKDRSKFLKYEEIIKKIRAEREKGARYLEIIGGEPTICPDYLELIKYAKNIGFKEIVSATNGRCFSYKQYAKDTIKAGISQLIFSIHGHNAKIHDMQTKVPGSFNELIKGLKNMKSLGFKRIGSNTTITNKNYRDLPEIGSLLLKHNIKNAEFIFVDPSSGHAKSGFKKLMPRISKAAPYIKKVLNLVRSRRGYNWRIRYVPLCYFPEHLSQISEIYERKKFRTSHIAPDFSNESVEESRAVVGRTKPRKCQNCVLYNLCEGIWNQYLKEFGSSELIAVKKKPKNMGRHEASAIKA
ncbi:radical SAM protein [Candidatus Margulisiibacteriota bacterium]